MYSSAKRVEVPVRCSDDVADDAADDRTREAAPKQIVAKTWSNPLGGAAGERRQPLTSHPPRALQHGIASECGHGRLHQGRRHAPHPELGAQPRHPVAAGGAHRDPVVGERRVIEVTAGSEVVHDGGGDVDGCAAAHESGEELGARPGAARQQVGRGQPRGRGVEGTGRARTSATTAGYDLRAKGLGAGLVGGASAFFSFAFSNVISPAEKMPRTLRSKSSALVVASRAVS
jgi:hypothetical protein